MAKQKYCYAIVHKENGRLLVDDAVLPIYWNREVARSTAKKHVGYIAHPVNLEELHRFILKNHTK